MGYITKKFEQRGYHPSDPNAQQVFSLQQPSVSGAKVDSSSVMSLSAVWAAINFYSTVIGSLPLHLLMDADNGKAKAKKNPKYNMLKRFANSEMTAMTYREYVINNTLLFGKSYSEKAFDGAGNLRELWPLPFYRVNPDRINGKKIYNINLQNGKTATLSRDEIFEVIGPANGTCVYTLLKDTFGLSLALNEFAARFFGSGANPGVIVSHPKTLSTDANKNLKKNLSEKHSGLGKSHRLLLLDEGMTIDKVGRTPEESQAIESRGFQINEVSRIFNLAPHILRELSKSSFNNIEQQSLETVIYSLGPFCVRLEQQMDMDLLSSSEKKNMCFRHNLEGLLRGDTESRAEFYKNMFLIGAFSINDILRLEERNTIGEEGNKRFVMSNMSPIDKIDNLYTERSLNMIDHVLSGKPSTRVLPYSSEKRIKSKEIDKIMEPLFKDSLQRVVNKEVKAIRSKTKKGDITVLRSWLAGFYEKLPEYIVNSVTPTFRSYAQLSGIDENVENLVTDFAEKYSVRSAREIISLKTVDEVSNHIDIWNYNKAGEQAELIKEAI
ncbi:MAG: phage portal protein [Deltaproteobacteria bacterium]|nr:phage portal protein [Deltaproteobacteria bacterium]